MIQEKDVEIRGKKYVISKLPATVGREVLFLYPTSNLPKVGDYGKSQEVMLKLLSYVGIRLENGDVLQLKTRELVDNHVPDAESLLLLEKEMFAYNYDFFQNGEASTFFQKLEKLATKKGIEMLTTLLGRLSQAEKQPSKSLEKTTP